MANTTLSLQARPVCVVVGVGPGNGTAFARHFTDQGYRVALVARSNRLIDELAQALVGARAYVCDATDASAVDGLYATIRKEMGEVEVLIYNAGSGAWGDVEAITPESFEAAWRVNALGALLSAQHVIPAMKRAGHGTILFTGATASRRGVPQTAAFAPAKAAQRALAESMARHLWPFGIHVSLMVIDGVVDLPRTRGAMPDKPDDFFIRPADVAATAFYLTTQPRSVWSFEVEARPYAERW